MSECRLISQSMIPLSVDGVASKPLSLDINSDDLPASCYTHL